MTKARIFKRLVNFIKNPDPYKNMKKVSDTILNKATSRYSSKNNVFVGLKIGVKRFNSSRKANQYAWRLLDQGKSFSAIIPLYYGSK